MSVPERTRQTDWEFDCIRWYGKVLTGAKQHWCPDWDYLPIDETTPEIDACTCFDEPSRVAGGDE